MKKLLSSFIALVLVATLFIVPTFAQTTAGVTLVQDGNFHYVHFGANTDSDHFTDIDGRSLDMSGFIDELSFSWVSIDAPLGASTFVVLNESGEIVGTYDLSPNSNVSIGFNEGYIEEIEWDFGDYSTGLSLYPSRFAKFYFVSDKEPLLTGETAFVTNYDNPISESEIRSHLSAFDDVDGDLTHMIQLTSSTYNPATTSIGQYELNYSVSDLSGNTTTLKVYVLVKDVSAPTVSLTSNHSSISYTQTFNLETLKSSIQTEVRDNFDSNMNVNVVVKSNSYTASKTIPGSYPITFELTDTSGNKSEYVYTVNVIDDVKPIVTYNETIVKSATSTMTLQAIMADITATDIISGNVTSSLQVVSDGYTGNGNRVGTYPIEFSVNDSAGNYTNFVVNVQVLDNIPPVFMVTPGQFIRVEDIITLTNEDFVDILVKTGQLSLPAGTSYVMLVNEYEGNESMPGIYAVSMKFMAPTGETEIESFAVQVLETEALDGVIDDTRDLYTKVIDYVKANPIESGIAFVSALLVFGIIGYLAFAKQDHKPAYARKTKYSKYRRK